MRLSGFSPAVGRTMVVALGVAVMLTVVSAAEAQTPPPAAAAVPAPAPPDPLMFTSERAALMFQIKQPEMANFEAAWQEILAGLAKSTKPEVQALGASMKSSKVMLPMDPANPALYLVYLDPPSKSNSYDLVKVLFDTGAFERAQADAIYAKLKAAVVGIQGWPLQKIGG